MAARAKKKPKPNNLDVAVGQVWEDNDSRAGGRLVKVLAIEGDHAEVECVKSSPYAHSTGKVTRIRLNRFYPTSNGYRLVEEGQ